MEKVQRWRKALTDAANHSGWECSLNSIEYEIVEKIAKDVSEKPDHVYVGDLNSQIAMYEQLKKIQNLHRSHALKREMESSNVKNKSSGKRKMSSEDTRSYFAWNLEMEHVLADVLRDQRNLGNKGDGNWKAIAYSTVAQSLSKHFGVHLMADNVKNCFKLWRTWYEISHEEAKRFQFKDDIAYLYVKDRATGLGAKNALDADDIMSKETNEEETIHSVSFDLEGSSVVTRKNIRPSKSGEKEGMISSMKEVVESLKEFVEVTKKKMENKKKMEIKEAQEVVHEVVSELDNIPNFNGALRHRAIDWSTENLIKFAIIKALPLDEKEDYISILNFSIQTYSKKKGTKYPTLFLGQSRKPNLSVIIFSKKFATSKWCLDEVVKILECKERRKQIVVPIFYHIEPSIVRNQIGSYGEAFSEHEQRFQEKSLRTGDLRDTEDLTTTLHPYFMKPCMRTDDQAFGVT
ncbi:TMV resistance protein N [Glycine max]|nr:TMV resistance protein N [Glycine max]